MDTKRKIEESLALLNSIIAHPNKKQSTGQPTSNTPENSLSDTTASPTVSTVSKKRVYLPPRPAVLDKLSRLSSSRPTLKDSIAASIAASAPTSNPGSSEPTTSTSVSDLASLSSTATKTTVSPNSIKRKYMPWSRDQFHERLETFKPSTWFDKPKVVNPVECAKRGWINKGNDRLECFGGCGGVVIVRIDQDQSKAEPALNQGLANNDDDESHAEITDNDEDVNDVLSELALGPKFHAMLTENHEPTCPWRVHPCDDNIYKFPVVSLSQAKAELLERVQLLKSMENDSLIEKIRHPLLQDQVDSLESVFNTVSNTKLLILSLFGWSAPQEQKILYCEACHTRCAYISSSGPNSFNTFKKIDMDEDEIMEEEDEASFDVVQSHKWYCYWVNAEQGSNQSEGWRTLLGRLISSPIGKNKEVNDSAESQSGHSAAKIEPKEALAQVRRILRGQAPLVPNR